MGYPNYDEKEAVDRANGVLTAEDEAWQEVEKSINRCESTIARLNTDEGKEQVFRSAVALTNYCHGVASDCGWWKATSERDVPRLLMLCVSELAEAMEGDRKQLMDDHLPGRPMLEVELADAVIRIFDMAGGLKLDVAGAIAEKMIYNTKRADHKIKNRENGGKRY